MKSPYEVIGLIWIIGTSALGHAVLVGGGVLFCRHVYGEFQRLWRIERQRRKFIVHELRPPADV